jgi:hypothetical protein
MLGALRRNLFLGSNKTSTVRSVASFTGNIGDRGKGGALGLVKTINAEFGYTTLNRERQHYACRLFFSIQTIEHFDLFTSNIADLICRHYEHVEHRGFLIPKLRSRFSGGKLTILTVECYEFRRPLTANATIAI